jgi:serine/threonine protein kinase/tetratricopeptide (TPR) repeat protein
VTGGINLGAHVRQARSAQFSTDFRRFGGRFMSSSEPARPAPAPPKTELSLSKGASIGRYIILGPLGRGGMGEVYAAYDPELNRKIAIKLLHARGGASTVDGHTRLLREAQAIARLSHPNVVVVYDVGTFQDTVFIAMEFLEGNTLGYWLQAQQRTWRDVVDVFLLAGRGLVAAHAAGLVHRDFKPDNVMITKGGQVRVMDFGLAREENRDEPVALAIRTLNAGALAAAVAATIPPDVDPDATMKLDGAAPGDAVPKRSATPASGYLRMKLTQTGAMLGTPAYMAPEQFAGTGGDARTDQFAFSVALYEGLYGSRPFAGNDVATVMANVLAGRLAEPPDNSHVPGWIRKTLLRGLSTRLEDRFPSMAELLAALSRDPATRQRRWIAAVAAVCALVAVGVGIQRLSANQRTVCAGGAARAATAWGVVQRKAVENAFIGSGHRHATQTFATMAGVLDGYLARWTGMYTEACEATQVRGEQSAEVLDLRMECLNERLTGLRALTTVFQTADTNVVENAVGAANALSSSDRCADVAMLRAVIRPPDAPAKHAEVERLKDEVAKINALASAGRCDQARTVGVPVLQAAKRLEYKPLEAEISYALGRLFDTCLDPKEALADLEDAVMAAEASRHDEIAIDAAAMLGSAYADLTHDVRLARQWVRLAEAILARFPGHPHLEARVAACRAVVLYFEGRFEESLGEEQRVWAIRSAAFGPSSVEVAMSNNNLATTLHELGRDQEAATSIHRAIETFVRMLGEDNGRVALASLNECEILTALGRYAEARASVANALRIWHLQGGSSFYMSAAVLYQGQLELAEGHAGAAVSFLERALPLLGTQDRHLTASAQFSLSRALLMLSSRNLPRALELARSARSSISGEPASEGLARKIEAWQQQVGAAKSRASR